MDLTDEGFNKPRKNTSNYQGLYRIEILYNII